MNSVALPTVAESSSVRTCGGSRPSESSQTTPRSGSVKLWNSSITTALTLAEVEGLAVQQAVEEDFGHHDQHAGVGVLAAIAGHQAHVVGMETPAGGG